MSNVQYLKEMPDNAVRPTEERRGRISRRGSRESRWISSHADTLRGSRAPSRATESALSSAEERVPSTAPTVSIQTPFTLPPC